ncbi:uncharacterized protein JCM6883_004858 [Sporobolomyces salmoneus]|uniref:uncharacterized protein n=1 Tax=Sporobolomyces salmoneus TaxID=183962 RepID=UPI00316E7370
MIAQDSKALAEADKEGTANHQQTKKITIRSTERNVKLVSVEFRDSQKRRHFWVQTFSRPVSIPKDHSLDVSVHFLPRNDIGSYSDTLIFVFESRLPGGGGGTCTIPIHRTIHGQVGIKQDVERFSSRTPYVKPDLTNRPRADPKKTIKAPKDDFVQNTPWTGNLPWYGTPKWMLELVETKTISEQIRELKRTLGGQPSYQNYARFWSTVLQLESYQEEVDVRRYDKSNVSLEKTGSGQYYLDVPGLAEKRPSVLRSDKIKVQTRTSSDKRWYEGIVTSVEEARVLLRFNKSFKPEANARYDVQFTISRIPTRRQLKALEGPLPRSHLLFPTLGLDAAFSDVHEFNFFSPAIASNPSQSQAVTSIVNNTSGDAPYVVFGPPGTGKTVTIIESCHQLVRHLDARILLTAPSNSAADLLCLRLDLPKESIFRLYAPSRMREEVPQSIMDMTLYVDGSFACPTLERLEKYQVVVTTCISASILRGVGLREGHFSHLFVDEAGQATEPEAFLPLSLADEGTKVVLAGDPKQLGPIVRSPVARTLGLETSLLERLMSTPQYDQNTFEYRGLTYSKLVQNYRNHRAILSTSNKEFYSNELVCKAPVSIQDSLKAWEGWPKKGFPIIFHSVKGRDEREGTSPSFFNVAEISMVRHYVESLQKSKRVKVLDSDIGIIAPYSAQCSKLRIALNGFARDKLTIGTVEQFQGSERSVILMSTVRSNKEYLEQDKRFAIGFLGNEKRFNVAVTRPQAGLIVVGDPDILSLDPLWRRCLIYVHENGGWRGQDWDPSFDPVESARDGMADLISRFGALDGLGMDD